MAIGDKLKVTRDQLAEFIKNHNTIRQFERLFEYINTFVIPASQIYPTYEVFNITTSSDEVYELPDAVTALEEVTIKRRGSGTGKVTFTTASGQTIDGLNPDQFELRDEVEITLFPNNGNWEQKSVVNDWVALFEDPGSTDTTKVLDVEDGKYKVTVTNAGETILYVSDVQVNTADFASLDFYGVITGSVSVVYDPGTTTWSADGAAHFKSIERWQDRVKLAGL